MIFYTGSQFPAEYRDSILVAEHGSWNRSRKIGYRVMRVALDAAGKPARNEAFAEGWLEDEEVGGRPVDLAQLPDGSVLLSDDEVGAIYRISYEPPRARDGG
jgi:glucose/arabinose dehydrogenase